MSRQEKRFIFQWLLFLPVLLLLAVPSFSLSEDIEWKEDTDYDDLTDYVLLSDPAGGRGQSVTLVYDLMNGLPAEREYRWYTCDASGSGEKLLSRTAENRFETGEFGEPEVRYYRCEMRAGEETRRSLVFAAGYTGLPAIRIFTESGDAVTDKQLYERGTMRMLTDSGAEEYGMSIRCRGHATLGYPKRPYTLKLDRKAELLGMEPSKKWVLLPGYCDKTLLRAALGLKTGELLGMAYTPEYRYVDLVINDYYAGTYLLTETVKAGARHLGMGDGAYIVEETTYDDEELFFRTTKKNLLYQFKYPDAENVTDEVLRSVSKEIDRMEKKLMKLDPESESFTETIDAESWINWLLVQNILANKDTNRYYYRTQDDDRIGMGPVWDFEWSVGIGWYDGERPNPEHTFLPCTPYFKKLLKNQLFRRMLKAKWDEVYPSLEDQLIRFTDETAAIISVSRELNFRRWRILDKKVSVGGIPLGTCEAELACDQAYLKAHIEWLNQWMNENIK